MTIRQALEQAEHQRLDPRAAFSDRSRGRPVPEPEREDDVRTCYQRIRTASSTAKPSAA